LRLAHQEAQIHNTSGHSLRRVLQLPDHYHHSVMEQFNTAQTRLVAGVRESCSRVEQDDFAARKAGLLKPALAP